MNNYAEKLERLAERLQEAFDSRMQECTKTFEFTVRKEGKNTDYPFLEVCVETPEDNPLYEIFYPDEIELNPDEDELTEFIEFINSALDEASDRFYKDN
jgi:hypothetical protein